ncbi:MAG: C40 family peptidase [Rubrobacter sp.]|nr:C40 family peptidase [Rubrobacter sp.]
MQRTAVQRVSVLFAAVALFSVALFMSSTAEAEAQTSGEQVVNEARSWIGTPYQYGGDTRAAVDCSGFTMLVMQQFGVDLPRTTDAQFGTGAKSGAEAGDLVFFTNGGNGISHAGIATGNGTVIHASYQGVAETPMKYLEGYAGAKDVL